MSRISIEVTPDIHKAIKLAAIDNGLSLKDFVIHKLMENHTHKKLKSSAGHDDCPLCRAFGGKNKKYKKLKPSDMKIVGKYKTAKDMFADLLKE